MDITSPINLWKDYDVAALPLNALALSEKIENGIAVKEYYFDGYTTVDGRVRAYIKIYVHPEARGVILYMPDNRSASVARYVSKLHSFGYSVAVLDYLGKSDAMRFTFYPKSLSYCNLNGVKKFNIPDGVLGNWYIWTCISRRAILLIKELFPGQQIFALGVGLGGSTVYKLAAFDDGLTACATMLNILPEVDGEGNSIINYRASLDNSAYAPFCKVPMFIAVASNAHDGSFDDMAELAKNTASLSHFRIIERAFADGIVTAFKDLNKFFTVHASAQPCAPRPSISAANSEGNLYFNIDINGMNDFDGEARLDMFVSFCIEDPTFRNWMNFQTISLGRDKYMVHINVCQENKPIYAFANLVFDDGTVQSSELIEVMPKSLGIKPKVGVSHHKIYDGSMGLDGWTTRNGGTIALIKGPYDIEGVKSETNSLITFKPGDPLFQVSEDTLLQIMVCGVSQIFNITAIGKTGSYLCQVELKSDNDWNTFSLSHMNFKGPSGTLSDWSSVLMLEFSSKEEFILGSVIWV